MPRKEKGVAGHRDDTKLFNEPAPCKECPEQHRCGYFRLACEDYRFYVRTSLIIEHDRRPTPEIYDDVYSGVEDDGD